jgi:predicted alpha/beta hydrolase family esterase
MDTLGTELRKKGVNCVVTNHAYGFDIADRLAKKYAADPSSVAPIILIGHSLGANKTITMAQRLQAKNVPVRLIVLFDATAQLPIPNNVQEVLNLHSTKGIGVAVAGARGYSGTIDNQDLSKMVGLGHINIDKSKKLHAEVVAKVLTVLAEKPGIKKKKK